MYERSFINIYTTFACFCTLTNNEVVVNVIRTPHPYYARTLAPIYKGGMDPPLLGGEGGVGGGGGRVIHQPLKSPKS